MKLKPFYLVIGIAVILLAGYLFWGPLFPWSPLKPGFTKLHVPGAKVFIKDPAGGDSVLYRLDDILLEAENFHGLEYQEKIRIVVLNHGANMQRYLPWMRGSGFSVSLSAVNLIYIGPNARRATVGIGPHLKHELSHMLVDQNTTFKTALVLHEQGWLVEGLAEVFSGHKFYTKTEFLDLCRRKGIRFSGLQEQNPLSMSFGDLRLKYTYYRLFATFLLDSYGLDAIQDYLLKYLERPGDYRNLFAEIYSRDLEEILGEFDASLNGGQAQDPVQQDSP